MYETTHVRRDFEAAPGRIDALKKRLQDNALDMSAADIASIANDIAALEGRMAVTGRWLSIYDNRKAVDFEHDDAVREAKQGSIELLVTGPDDAWSGRGNDVRRARFDGMREGVRDLGWVS